MTPPVLEARGLSAGYGGAMVLRGIDAAIRPGEAVGLMGRNGMGKTTLIRALIGLLPAQSGHVLLDGQDAAALPPHARARLGIAVVPEGRGIFASLTVTENLRLAATRGEWTESRVLDLFPRLAQRASNRGNHLSGGEQQMLAIGRALMTNPRLLVLDEATEGLAPLVRDDIWRVIGLVKQAGVAVLVVDRTVSAVLGCADRVLVLSKGQVAWTGAPAGLDAATVQRHLGVGG